MHHGKHCKWWKCGHSLGLFLVLAFVLCFLWYFVNPVGQELHMELFKLSFLGFTGMNVVSFLLGAIQVYIWGYVYAGLWALASCGGKKCKH